MNKFKHISLIVTLFLSLFTFINAAPGDLDTTFNTNGINITPIGDGIDEIYGSALQSDGKIVVVGTSGSSSAGIFAVVRYNTDGSLDTTFDLDGKVTTLILGNQDSARSVAIQTDGKIVVGGRSFKAGTGIDFVIVRYNTNGSLDTTFGTDGKVITDFITVNELLNSIAIQSDGKIVAGGGSGSCAIARYNTNGTLDTTFDTDGKVMTVNGTGANCTSVTIQADGKIVASGFATGASNADFSVIRYNTNGSLDTSFDTDGKVLTDINAADNANGAAIQADGKIVLTGYSNSGVNFGTVRYNTDGSLDTTFDTDGKVETIAGVGSGAAKSIAIQTDGKIILAGQATVNFSGFNIPVFAAFRYNIDGSLDTTFDTDGKVTTRITTTCNCSEDAKSVII